MSYLVLKSVRFLFVFVNLQLQAGQFFCFLNITVIDTDTHLNCVDKTLVKLFFFPSFKSLISHFRLNLELCQKQSICSAISH